MTRIGTAAFIHCFRIGLREEWAQKVPLAGTFLSLAVIVAIWASVWRLVPAETLAPVALTSARAIWYFTLTEIVAFALGHAYRQVEIDLGSGNMTLMLARPLGYVGLKAAEEAGHTVIKLAVFAPPGLALAWAIAGPPSFGPGLIAPLFVLLMGGAAILLALQILIGLSAAWLGSARAVFFITQKCLFVLGGLIVPVTAYPAILQRIGFATPFPAMLYAPASLALDGSAAHVAKMLALEGLWLCVALGALWLAARAFERRIVTEGMA